MADEDTVMESCANGKAPEVEKAATEEANIGLDEKEKDEGAEISTEKPLAESEKLTGDEAPKEEDNNGNEEEKLHPDEKVEDEHKVETPKRGGRGRASTKRVSITDKKEQKEEVEEETPKEKDSKKRKAKDLSTTPVTIDRPSRERKTIERFVVSSEKENVKELTIEKGKGTQLKDIPNVAFKLAKRSRSDDGLKMLYSVLYGRRRKGPHLKSSILQFSGFVWGEDEEKLKGKLKDKLDKLNKDNLSNLCDILDVHVSKSTTKKEELVIKLMEFLESPYVTTDVLIEEQMQKLKAKKRKRRSKGTPGKSKGKAPGKSPRKRQKKSDGSKEEVVQSEEETEHEEDAEEVNEEKETDLGDEEDAPGSEKELEEEDGEDDEDYGVGKKGSKSSTKKGRRGRKSNASMGKKNLESKGIESSPIKSLRSPLKGSASKNSAISSPQNSPASKVFSRKNRKEKTESDKMPASDGKKLGRKQSNATADKSNVKEKDGKTKAKGKSSKSEPSDDELRSVICEILKKVDFNTATFTDIVKRLAAHFSMDFTERKAHVKVLIQEELSKLADDGDEEEDQSMGAEENAEKDESDEQAGQVVEAE